MLLACPNCGVKFRVAAKALGSSGKRVRCSQCGHEWQATPQQLIEEVLRPAPRPASKPAPKPRAAAAPPPPPPPPPPETMPAPEPPPAAMAAPEAAAGGPLSDAALAAALEPVMSATPMEGEKAAEEKPQAEGETDTAAAAEAAAAAVDQTEAPARGPRGKKPEKKKSAAGRIAAAIGWLLFALVVGGLAGIAYESDAVMEEFPATKPIFSTLGFDVPAPGDGLRLTNVTSSRVTIEGAPALVIEGKVTNTTGGKRTVPPLRGSLRDANDRELTAWTFNASTMKLDAGETASFRTEVKQPSAQATGLSIAFAAPQH